MNQREAVIEVMRANGGYATLGWLYREALKIPGVEWRTKTPFKSINRIVQNRKYFFRIRPGLWALLEAKNRLPAGLEKKAKPESLHTYYQGLLVELGNLRKQQTFVPKQDRNKPFLGKALGGLATLNEMSLSPIRRSYAELPLWMSSGSVPRSFHLNSSKSKTRRT